MKLNKGFGFRVVGDVEDVFIATRGAFGCCPICFSKNVDLFISPAYDKDELAYMKYALVCGDCGWPSHPEAVEIPRIWMDS